MAYEYDSYGNMTSREDENWSNWEAFGYDTLNRLVSTADGDVTYITYAADGRKLRVSYRLDLLAAFEEPDYPAEPEEPTEPDEPADPGEPTGGPLGLDPLSPRGLGDVGLLMIDETNSQTEQVLMTRDYCGSYTYRNGALERIMMGNGFLQDSAYYVQLKDYQGNVRAVLDHNATLVERNQYYPYGGLINPPAIASTLQIQPYKYSTKELDRENGLDLYDFSARMYDPMLPMFTSVDPLSEKKPWNSPYAYCGGNPILRIDISGKDDYNVNALGYFSLLKKTDDKNDLIYSMQGDNINYNHFISVDKSFIVSEKTVNIKHKMADGVIGTTSITYYKGDNLKKIYNFLNNNNNIVEWSLVEFDSGTTKLYFLGTAHNPDYDPSQSYFSSLATEQKGILIESRHIHPDNSLTPSKEDVDIATKIQDKYPNAQFFIDIPNGQMRKYDRTTTPCELFEIIVYPKKQQTNE